MVSNFITKGFIHFFCFLFVLGLSICKSPVYLTGSPLTSDPNGIECYTGLYPKFEENPVTRKIFYYSYRISKEHPTYGCVKVVLRKHELTPSVTPEVNQQITSIFSQPLVLDRQVAGQLNDGTSISNIDPEKYRGMLHIRDLYVNPFSKVVWYPKLDVIKNADVNDSFNIESKFRHSSEKAIPIPAIAKIQIKNIKEPKNIPQYPVDGPLGGKGEDLSELHYFLDSPELTTNQCWMLIPTVELMEDTGRSKFGHRQPNLLIHSLNEQDNGYTCNLIGSRKNNTAEEARRLKKTLVKHVEYKLLDFHAPIADGLFECGDLTKEECDELHIAPKLVDNNRISGVDFAAFSPSPNELEIIYQTGVESNFTKPEDEKLMKGNLEYIVFERIPRVDDRSDDFLVGVKKGKKGKEIRRTITTDDCDFKGWASQPLFSRDKKNLYFVAMETLGHDRSRNNLYMTSMESIRSGTFNCKSDVKNLTNSNFNYPILSFYLDPDQRRLSIIFEEEGESVVRFFKLNSQEKRIVYQYPEIINGVGKIYDLISPKVQVDRSKTKTYYVFHSYDNAPIGISKCYLREQKFICGDRFKRSVTSSFHNDPLNRNKGLELYEVDVTSLEELRKKKKLKVNTVPTKILLPTDKIESTEFKNSAKTGEKKINRAIISIHGGPNESWDGTFHPRENLLAQRGYTIFMPNPTGSTGYGYDYTHTGRKSWGTKIYDDIADVVTEVRELKFDKLYLMGFSFGGYMVNWIQTNPEAKGIRKEIDGFIGISALYDLRDFARTTDQLWFSEWQLGCSGDSCKIACPDNPKGDSRAFLSQNPACYSPIPEYGHSPEQDSILISKNPIGPNSPPTYFISGTKDLRIHYESNVPDMLAVYRKNCAPYTFRREPYRYHAFSNSDSINQADAIDQWIKDIESADCSVTGRNKLSCQSGHDRPRYRGKIVQNEVFDNLIPYKHYAELASLDELNRSCTQE